MCQGDGRGWTTASHQIEPVAQRQLLEFHGSYYHCVMIMIWDWYFCGV